MAGNKHHAGRHVGLRWGPELVEARKARGRGWSEPPPEGWYRLTERRAFLCLPGPGPPAGARFSLYLERGWNEGGTTRVFLDGLAMDGIPVWAGGETSVEVDVPRASTLRFGSCYRGLGARPGEAARMRILRDGEEIFACTKTSLPGPEVTWHELPLEPGRARLTLLVEGDPGQSAFVLPTIGPGAIGSRGDRRLGTGRPDIVIFLADTFRADNLAAWGGAPEVAPNLNRLADRSLRFLRARAPGVWTLPSHASLFTGLYPPQHGAILEERALPDGLPTLAELLSTHGYRTGAVTDAGFVSRHYGLDRGFAWFQEREFAAWDLTETFRAAQAFLERDDGRPVFLFVHTYRVHTPYRTGPDEDKATWKRFMARRKGLQVNRLRQREELAPELARLAEEFHDLYREGVTALDRELGSWLDDLGRRGFLEDGYLIVTSDHGEAFFEHGDHGHKGAPYEEKVRIPLLVHGPGIEPRDVLAGASLLDLSPTVASLARIPAPSSWEGRALLEPLEERPFFVFHEEDETSYLAIVEGDRKVLTRPAEEALRSGHVDAAFDLGSDPGEANDVGRQARWPQALCRGLAGEIRRVSSALAPPRTIELTEDLRRRLAQIGYGGS